MEIELGQSFIETPQNLQNITKQLQSSSFGVFQKRIYFAYGISNMIHSFDLCAILFLSNQPLLIGGYLLFYVFGYIASAKYQIKISISERIGAQLQIAILLLISMTKIFQYQYILLALILVKSLISGYCNGLLQLLRYSFLTIQFNMGYLMAIFIILQLYFFKTQTQIIHYLIGEQVLILLSCIYRAKYLPPLFEQIENNEIDQYLRYINKCIHDDSMIDYEEYKNGVENESRISITLQSAIQIQIPTFQKLIRKLFCFNEEIYKYLISQVLLGFLFYSNLMYFRYYLPNYCYFWIVALSFSQGCSKSFNEYLANKYDWRNVYVYSQILCIISQIIRLIGFFEKQDQSIFIVTTLIQALFHHSMHSEIVSDYKSFILLLCQILKHIGGIFLAYSLFEYLQDADLYKYSFLQTTIFQCIYFYFGYEQNIIY